MNYLPVARAVALLAFIAIAIRVAVFLVYEPVAWPDTNTYHTLASQILGLDFREYRGIRAPGYSFLLVLAGQSHVVVWLIQSALGVLVSLLLFWICLAHTGSATWAFLAGLLHSLALNQLFFEANVMSETLATFLVVLSVALFLGALRRGAVAGYGAAGGIAAALATLVRPVYVYLGPLYVVLVVLFEKNGKRLALSLAVAFCLPVFGWMSINKATIDYFGLSTVAGYGITNHSGRFMEKAGDQYATIRDIYLKYRDQKIAETGSHAMTIFLARSEMLEKTGLDEVAMARQLTKLSLELFVSHPTLYLRGVFEAWASFWAVPIYMSDKFTSPGAAKVVNAIWPLERALLLVANFLAIATSGWVIASAAFRRLKGKTGLSIPLIVSCVLMAASVLQALVEYGENPRYGIPTQSLAVTLVLLAMWDLRTAFKPKSASGERQAREL